VERAIYLLPTPLSLRCVASVCPHISLDPPLLNKRYNQALIRDSVGYLHMHDLASKYIKISLHSDFSKGNYIDQKHLTPTHAAKQTDGNIPA